MYNVVFSYSVYSSLQRCILRLYHLTFPPSFMQFARQIRNQIFHSHSASMASDKVCGFLLCLAVSFHLSCQQPHDYTTAAAAWYPAIAPQNKTENSNSEWVDVNKTTAGFVVDNNCSICCTNFSCMYNLIIEGLRESDEFEALGNLLHLSEGDTPVFYTNSSESDGDGM